MKQFKSLLLMLIGMIALTAFTSCDGLTSRLFEEKKGDPLYPSDWDKWSTEPANPLPIETYSNTTWDVKYHWQDGTNNSPGKWATPKDGVYVIKFRIPIAGSRIPYTNSRVNNGNTEGNFILSDYPKIYESNDSDHYFYPIVTDTIVTISRHKVHGGYAPSEKWVRRK